MSCTSHAISQVQIDEIISRRQAGEFQHAIAMAMGLGHATVNKYCKIAAQQGKLLSQGAAMDGFEITKRVTKVDDGYITEKTDRSDEALVLPEGHILKRASLQIGRSWYKTELSRTVDPIEYATRMEEAFANFGPVAPITPRPEFDFLNQLTVYPWADPHFGMFAWKGDSGRNWDLKLAVNAVKSTFNKLVHKSPRTRKALLIIGGDILHADNQAERTRSNHQLDVDGRFTKVVDMAGDTAAWNVQLLLCNHDEVEVIVLPGNHDENSFYAITMFLRAWFRNEPRVTVDRSPNPFRHREYGLNMISMTHGHMAKAKRLPMVMAHDEREMWGRARFTYAHTFHVHHASKDQDEDGATVVETHRIIAPADAWHYAMGYRSGRGLQSITYDPETGESGRSVENIR